MVVMDIPEDKAELVKSMIADKARESDRFTSSIVVGPASRRVKIYVDPTEEKESRQLVDFMVDLSKIAEKRMNKNDDDEE